MVADGAPDRTRESVGRGLGRVRVPVGVWVDVCPGDDEQVLDEEVFQGLGSGLVDPLVLIVEGLSHPVHHRACTGFRVDEGELEPRPRHHLGGSLRGLPGWVAVRIEDADKQEHPLVVEGVPDRSADVVGGHVGVIVEVVGPVLLDGSDRAAGCGEFRKELREVPWFPGESGGEG